MIYWSVGLDTVFRVDFEKGILVFIDQGDTRFSSTASM